MAYEYDRFEREDGGGSFLMGLLAGTVLGAGLGMLFAPKAGADLRNQVSEQADACGQRPTTRSQATEKVSQMVDRGREAYDRARAGGGFNVWLAGRLDDRRQRGTPSGAGAGTGGYGAGGYGSDRG